jgi:hypothetical protein
LPFAICQLLFVSKDHPTRDRLGGPFWPSARGAEPAAGQNGIVMYEIQYRIVVEKASAKKDMAGTLAADFRQSSGLEVLEQFLNCCVPARWWKSGVDHFLRWWLLPLIDADQHGLG